MIVIFYLYKLSHSTIFKLDNNFYEILSIKNEHDQFECVN